MIRPYLKVTKSDKKGKGDMWTTRVVVKYALLQVPAAALAILAVIFFKKWMDLPAWLAWGLVVLWVAKDVVLFPFVWRAYDSRSGRSGSMVGELGIAEERLAPSGYARVRGELWHVDVMGDGTSVEKGDPIRVHEMHGLTLLVRPEEKKN